MNIKLGQIYESQHRNYIWICSEEFYLNQVTMVGFKTYSIISNDVIGNQIIVSKQYFLKNYKLNVFETMKLLKGLDKWNDQDA